MKTVAHRPFSLPAVALLASIILVSIMLMSGPAIAIAASANDSTILATEAEGEGSEAPATTVVSEGGIAPAEVVPPSTAEPAADQWTAKFLAPLVAILGALGVIAAIAMYGLRLRARYRIVE